MPSEKYPEKAHRVDKETAWENASLAIIRNAVANTPGVADWLKGRVRKAPVTIYDINGSPLFYDFPVVGHGGEGGIVRTAASRVLGKPIIAIELSNRHWNFNKAVKKLLPKVRKGRSRVPIPRPKLVCYSYPKLGVMFEVPNARGRIERQIYDVASLERVRELQSGSEREGQYAWSYYDSLNNRKRSSGLKAFEKVDAMRIKQSPAFRKNLARATKLEKLVDITKLKLKLSVTKTLQFCPHYTTSHARSHHCFVLHGQEVNDYCAVATCQMILCYYRYYYDQDDIAPNLGYTAGSGCPSDQSAGYQTLSNNHINATFDSSATWAEARSQINQLHPMKSGIPGHARAVAGYSYMLNAWPFSITERKLYVYDPWPWNADYSLAGAVYWEDWDSVSHTNFIYTELDY